MENENTPPAPQTATTSGSETVRIELRANGKLLAGVTTSQMPTDADEAMEILRSVNDAPTVPDPELI